MATLRIQYYFFINDNPKSPKYKKPMSVYRMRREKDGLYPERWDGKKREWVFSRGLVAVSGMGGDHPYDETTEEEAMKFIEEMSNDEHLRNEF